MYILLLNLNLTKQFLFICSSPQLLKQNYMSLSPDSAAAVGMGIMITMEMGMRRSPMGGLHMAGKEEAK